MTMRSVIQSQTRKVVSFVGESWTHYARTGGLDQAPTYSGTGTSVTVLPTQRTSLPIETEDSSRDSAIVDVRITDAQSIEEGDALEDTGGVQYVVVERVSGDTGTALYRIRRDTLREVGPARGGRLER